MSEINNNEVTPQELVEEVYYGVQDAEVIPPSIDPTLTIPGASADAYATGQAILHAVDGVQINGKTITNKTVALYAGDIHMSNEQGANTIAQEIENLSDRTAEDIMYDGETMISTKEAIDGVKDIISEDFTQEEVDAILAEVFEEGDEN